MCIYIYMCVCVHTVYAKSTLFPSPSCPRLPQGIQVGQPICAERHLPTPHLLGRQIFHDQTLFVGHQHPIRAVRGVTSLLGRAGPSGLSD